MTNKEFYKKLDQELLDIIEQNPSDEQLHQHKNVDQNKAYALLIWFLKFYGQTLTYKNYITEGYDDNSCDIILDLEDSTKNKNFYVVQAKWNTEKNSSKKIDSTQFKATIEDFKLLLDGKKSATKNKRFNKKYTALKKHIENNGTVKFIYFALNNFNPSVNENIAAFSEEYNSSILVFDLNTIKSNYIDRYYKQIIPTNPLEKETDPQDEEIRLEIEQLSIKKNFLKVDKPFESYIFLLLPKMIFKLFYKHNFILFQ